MYQAVEQYGVPSQSQISVESVGAQKKLPAYEGSLVRRMHAEPRQPGKPPWYSSHSPNTQVIKISHHHVAHDNFGKRIRGSYARKYISQTRRSDQEVVCIEKKDVASERQIQPLVHCIEETTVFFK